MKLTTEQRTEIKEAMEQTCYTHRTINGVDHYINAAVKEGIEMKGDKINPYAIDSGDKVFGYDKVGDTTRRAVEVIEQVLIDMHVGEVNKNELIPANNIENYGVTTQDLTDSIMKQHPGSIPLLLSFQRTMEADIKERPGMGNKMIKYVEGHTMINQANHAFLFNWNSDVMELWEDDYEISALVECTFNFTEGYSVSHTQVGCADKKFSKSLKDKDGNPRCILIGDTRKAAITDGEKKCMSLLNMNKDIYGGYV